MITIITDSTADLNSDLVVKYQIVVIPLQVNLGGKTYLDGIDITTPQLFQLVTETGQLPQTAAPSIESFKNVFSQAGEHIYIGLSSQLSATYQNAELAFHETGSERVTLIDSLNISNGIGLLVLKAAELRDKGLTAIEITEKIKASIPKVRTSFVIETMEYLYKGGRCSAVQNLIGSLLKIRPVIQVEANGKLSVKDKVRGNRRKALDSLLLDLKNHLAEVDRHRIFVAHTGCEEDAQYLAYEIRAMCAPDEVCVAMAGSVIASHGGPDTIGILYLVK